MPLPIIPLVLIKLGTFIIPILKVIPKNQHAKFLKILVKFYKKFGFDKTYDMLKKAGSAAAVIAILKKTFKDDY